LCNTSNALSIILSTLNNGRRLGTATILTANHPENLIVTLSLAVIIVVLIGLLVEERLSFEAAVAPVRKDQ